MVRDAVFNVTDVYTSLKLLTDRASMMALNCTFEDIRKLDITLRLPEIIFRAIEQDEDKASKNYESLIALAPTTGSTEVGPWHEVCGRLAQLPKLTKMRLWLDHDQRGYWARVDERAFLTPLITSLEHKDVDVALHLPFANPRWEDPERHFEQDKVAPRIHVDRRKRQRKFGYVTVLGRLEVHDYLDFPCMDETTPVFGDMDADQRLAMERRLWKDGENMQLWRNGGMHISTCMKSFVDSSVREQNWVGREKELGCTLKWPAVL